MALVRSDWLSQSTVGYARLRAVCFCKSTFSTDILCASEALAQFFLESEAYVHSCSKSRFF